MINKPNRKVKKHTKHVPLKAVADVRVPKQRELVEAIVKENNGRNSKYVPAKFGYNERGKNKYFPPIKTKTTKYEQH